MKKLLTYIAIFTISILIYTSCTEQYEPKTGTFEQALVIESTITNELKKQTVKLSRVRKLENEFSNKEKNAQVWIEANNNTYNFTEIEAGMYQSDIVFKAVSNTEYILFITAQDGKQYKSKPVLLAPEAPISNLYAQEETVNNKRGIQVFLDNNNNGNAKYFRYEFDETYKIIPPYRIYDDVFLTNIILLPSPFLAYDIVTSPTTIEKNFCYSTNTHQKIIQTNLGDSSINNIIKFPIRFIADDDYLIRERYSILVKQYTQTFDAYNFYEILSKLGNVESLLSEVQTGFVTGNLFSENNPNEKVIGFFNVSSFSEKRIFFSFYDFNFAKPEYIEAEECAKNDVIMVWDYRKNSRPDQRQLIYQALEETNPPREFLDVVDIDGKHTILTLLRSKCGNCSTFASNIRPDFWID